MVRYKVYEADSVTVKSVSKFSIADIQAMSLNRYIKFLTNRFGRSPTFMVDEQEYQRLKLNKKHKS